MRMRLIALLSLVLLAFAAPNCVADTPMTRLRIEVKTINDKPIDRASVVVKFVEGRSVIKLGKKVVTTWQLKTNQEGVVKVPELPQGKILIQVIAKGYQTFGETVDVNEEERTVAIKLNPPQPQHSEH